MLRMFFQMTIKTVRVWVQLKFINATLLNIASYHRPQNSRNELLALIYNDISNTMKNTNICNA